MSNSEVPTPASMQGSYQLRKNINYYTRLSIKLFYYTSFGQSASLYALPDWLYVRCSMLWNISIIIKVLFICQL